MKCFNRESLALLLEHYVRTALTCSVVFCNRLYGIHEEIAEATGIPYDELSEYLHRLENYGIPADYWFKEVDFSEEDRIVKKVVSGLLNDLLFRVEQDAWRRFFYDDDIREFLLSFGYSVDEWLDEWRDNGFWLCDGEPVLNA